MGFHSDDSILRDLAMDSGNLIDLVDHFVRLASRDSIAVICFFEQHLSSYNKGPNLFRALLPWKEMVCDS